MAPKSEVPRADAAGTKLRAVVLGLSLSACSGGAPASASTGSEDAASPRSEELLALRYRESAPEADPSNDFAEDEAALRFGRALFFDPSLSGPLIEGDNDGSGGTLGVAGEAGKVSCASCHVPESGFVDTRSPHRQISLAAQWTERRSPTLLDVAFMPLYNWDGRRDSIWGQAAGVMESDREFNSSRLFIAQRLFATRRDEYEALFGAMPPLDDPERFPPLSEAENGCREINSIDGQILQCRGKPGDDGDYDGMAPQDQEAVTRVMVNAAKAIAAYVRALRCGPGRFDQWLDGDDQALSPLEVQGANLFVGEAGCAECHTGPFLSDGEFHNVGLQPAVVAVAFVDSDDRGAAAAMPALQGDPLSTRGSFSDGIRDVYPLPAAGGLEGAFRTPTLRCIANQPSFMHTGQFKSLGSVVDFFVDGGHPRGYLGDSELTARDLDEEERSALVAFLSALIGDGPDASLLEAP